jgi:hypothetical protein
VSDMARNMKLELLTFSLILYQSKNWGHGLHVLFMMYDVYGYCQMKKNEWLWKFWKRNDLFENFEKRGVVEKKGGGGNEIHAPWVCDCLSFYWFFLLPLCCLQTFKKLVCFQIFWICAHGEVYSIQHYVIKCISYLR